MQSELPNMLDEELARSNLGSRGVVTFEIFDISSSLGHSHSDS
jgi:hypothetical protein